MEKISVKKGVLKTLVALLFVGSMSVVLTALNLSIWVVWMGMCVWAAFGMSMKLKDIVKLWMSASFAVGLGYLLTSGKFGEVGLLIGGIIILFFVYGMVTHQFTMLCNNYSAIFLTCTTAHGVVLEPLQLAKSLLFGFLVFGLLPYGIVQWKHVKKGKEV